MATTRLENFNRRMREIARRFEGNTGKAVRRAAIAADQTAVLATPVDTGRARGNWRVAIGAPNLLFDSEASDQSGGQTISDGQATIATWNVGSGSIFISNSVPYIIPLDTGTSAQAPNGMSAAAIQAARAQLARGGLLRDL